MAARSAEKVLSTFLPVFYNISITFYAFFDERSRAQRRKIKTLQFVVCSLQQKSDSQNSEICSLHSVVELVVSCRLRDLSNSYFLESVDNRPTSLYDYKRSLAQRGSSRSTSEAVPNIPRNSTSSRKLVLARFAETDDKFDFRNSKQFRRIRGPGERSQTRSQGGRMQP